MVNFEWPKFPQKKVYFVHKVVEFFILEFGVVDQGFDYYPGVSDYNKLLNVVVDCLVKPFP